METAHVKDLLAHLRVLANPQDTISWQRVLMLLEGIGPGASQKITKWLVDGSNTVERLRSYPAKSKIAQGLRTLAQVLEEAGHAELPSEQSQYLLQYYIPILKQNYPDDHPKRLRDMEHFQGMTERYRSLERLLSDMALEPPNDSIGGVLAVDPDEGPLILSTIHSASFTRYLSFGRWKAGFPPSTTSTHRKSLKKSAGCSTSPQLAPNKTFLSAIRPASSIRPCAWCYRNHHSLSMAYRKDCSSRWHSYRRAPTGTGRID
jgi:hypothetical protein